MGTKTTNIKLKKKLNRIRNQKNCIPPKIKANDWDPDNDGVTAYRESHPQGKYIPIIERKWKCSKKPWYFLTKKETIAIWSKRGPTKMTHEEYVEAYLKQKLSKWENKNPKPKEDDLFYKEEYPQWVSSREEQHDKIVASLNKKYINRYTRPLITKILDSRFKESKIAYKKAA